MGREKSKNGFKDLAISIGIALAISLYLFSFLGFSTFNVTNSTDSSWQYSLSGLRHDKQSLGLDIYYTYGPLFEVMPTFVHAQDTFKNFFVGNILFLFIVLVNAYVFLKIILFIRQTKKIQKQLLPLSLITLAGVVLTLTDLDTAFNLALLATLFAARIEKRYSLKVLMLTAIYVLSYYKFSYFVPAVLITPLVFIESLYWKNLLQSLYRCILPAFVCISLFFILTQSLSVSSLIKYLYYSIVNTAFYGEFMGLSYEENLAIVVLFSALYFFTVGVFAIRMYQLYFQYRNQWKNAPLDYVLVGAGFLLIGFFDFKHAIVRNDIHLLSFTPFLFLSLLFIYLTIQLHKQSASRKSSVKFDTRVLTAILTISVGIHIAVLGLLIYKKPLTAVKGYTTILKNISTQTLVNNRFNYKTFTNSREQSKANILVRSNDVKSIQAKLKKLPDQSKPLLFYGNTNMYGEVLKQDRTVLYSPFLQNYVAYPPTLADDMYIKFLNDHPNGLVFAEENEPSIDKRVPAHELNNFFQYLTHNYTVVASVPEKGQYVFERKNTDIKQSSCTVFSQVKVHDNERVKLPDLPSLTDKQYVQFRLNEQSYPAETLVSGLLKNPVYKMTLFTPDNAEMRVRTTRTTLEHGITIKPFNQSLQDYTSQRPFALGTFMIHDGLPTGKLYSGNIELCSF